MEKSRKWLVRLIVVLIVFNLATQYTSWRLIQRAKAPVKTYCLYEDYKNEAKSAFFPERVHSKRNGSGHGEQQQP